MNFTKAIIAIIAVFGFNVFAGAVGLYDAWHWLDIIMHFLGGFAMGMLGLALWMAAVEDIRFKKNFLHKLRWWLIPLFVLGFVAIIGIAWEWYEFLFDIWFDDIIRQPSLGDTMADFLLDLLGGFAAVLVFHRDYAKR